jgi:TPR repeat protein
MIDLGRLYEQGLGVAQDFGKALEWFEKAAGAGKLASRS